MSSMVHRCLRLKASQIYPELRIVRKELNFKKWQNSKLRDVPFHSTRWAHHASSQRNTTLPLTNCSTVLLAIRYFLLLTLSDCPKTASVAPVRCVCVVCRFCAMISEGLSMEWNGIGDAYDRYPRWLDFLRSRNPQPFLRSLAKCERRGRKRLGISTYVYLTDAAGVGECRAFSRQAGARYAWRLMTAV